MAIQKGDFNLAAQISKEMTQMSVGYGGAYAGATQANGQTQPFAGYEGNNFGAHVTPNEVSANYYDQSANGKSQFSAGGFATKDSYGAQASFKQLLENGYINIQGEITPEGYAAGIGGEFKF